MNEPTKSALHLALDEFTTAETRELTLHILHGLLTYSMMLSALEQVNGKDKDNVDVAAEARAHARMLKITEEAIGQPVSHHMPTRPKEVFVTPEQLARLKKQKGLSPNPPDLTRQAPIAPPPVPLSAELPPQQNSGQVPPES
jgi:hypothetical protein